MLFDNLSVRDVLYSFGEPLIFTSGSREFPVLCTKLDEDDDSCLFLVVLAPESLITGLRSGSISLRAAFFQEWCWVVRTTFEMRVTEISADSPNRLPADYFPDPGVGLYPHHGMIEDAYYSSSTTLPFMSVKFSGKRLVKNSIPLAVFKSLVDEVYVSFRKLFIPVVNQATSSSVSEAMLGRMLQLPMRQPQLASLSIEFDEPKINTSLAKKAVHVDLDAAGEKMVETSSRFVNYVSRVDQMAREGTVGNQLAYGGSLSLEAVVELLPSDTTPFDQLELGAKAPDGSYQRVTVDVDAGRQIRDAFYNARFENQTVVGKIVEMNDLSDTFIVQNDKGRAVTCVASTKDLAEAMSSYVEGSRISVTGRYEVRVRRDKLYVRSINAV